MMTKNTGSSEWGQFLSDLYSRIDITDVIGRNVNLRKQGSVYTGLCPFHEEKTPSFKVSPAKGIYKCFGCGKAGNAVSFIMEHNHRTYREALVELAKIYQIPVPTTEEEEIQKQNRDFRYSMLKEAARFFQKKTDKIRPYLNERGINNDSIDTFQIGCAPNPGTWNELTNHMLGQGFSIEELMRDSLTKRNARARPGSTTLDDYYDYFRDSRIIFPIKDRDGKIIAFGARINPEEERHQDPNKKNPKYINSRETSLYKKEAILYGIHLFIEHIKNTKDTSKAAREINLVEGYTDVIMLHQNGIFSVGKCGSMLSDKHLSLLSGYAGKITSVEDADPAGMSSTIREFNMIYELELEPSAILLPNNPATGKGYDPAEFMRNHTKSDFIALPKKNLAEYYIAAKLPKGPEERKIALDIITRDLGAIENPIRKFEWLQEVARLTGQPPELVMRKYTDDLRNRVLESGSEDSFSKKYLNRTAAKFIASLITLPPNYAAKFMEDIPFWKIPDDGSIFSRNMLELYRILSEDYEVGKFEFTLFKNPTLFKDDEAAAQNQMSLFAAPKKDPVRVLKDLIKMKGLKFYPAELSWALNNIPIYFSGQNNRTRKRRASPQDEARAKQEAARLENELNKSRDNIERLIEILMPALFASERDGLLVELSHRLSSKEEYSERDINETAKKIEALHNII